MHYSSTLKKYKVVAHQLSELISYIKQLLNSVLVGYEELLGILGNACTDTRTRTHGHGHTGTDTYGKDGQLWKRRALMEKTDSYGKDGQLWKRRALMEKTGTYGKDGQLWKRRAVMEKTGSYGKDGQLWKRQTLMEKTGTYGKDGHKAFETNLLSFKKEAHTVL